MDTTTAPSTATGTPEAPTAGTRARPIPLGRPFHVHLASVAIANLADGLVLVGAPLVAVGLTRSPGEISLLNVVFWLPWLLLGIVAGLVVDRTDRRNLRIVGMAVRAVILLGLAWAAFADALTMPLLIGATAAYGVTAVFVDLAGSAMVPQVAPRARLSAANGRVMGAETVMNNFVGGPVAGALLVLGSGWIFGAGAALCVVFVLVLLAGLRGSYRPDAVLRPGASAAGDSAVVGNPEPATEGARGHLARIREGLAFLLTHPVIRPLVIGASLMNMASTAYFSIFVLWVVGEDSAVGLRAEAFGLLLAVLAVGAVLGSVAAEPLQRWIEEVPLLFVVWTIQCVLLVVPVLMPTVPAIAATLFLMGFSNMIGNVVSQTVRQRLIPVGMLGRVGGAGATLGYGLMPVGALLGGVVGEVFGLPVVFLGAAAVSLVAVAYPALTVRQRMVREREIAVE